MKVLLDCLVVVFRSLPRNNVKDWECLKLTEKLVYKFFHNIVGR